MATHERSSRTTSEKQKPVDSVKTALPQSDTRAIDTSNINALSPDDVLQLQRTIGNQAVLRLMSQQSVQREAVSPPSEEQMQQDAAKLKEDNTILGVQVPISMDLLSELNPSAYPKESRSMDLPKEDRGKLTEQEIKGEAFIKGSGDSEKVDPRDVDQAGLGTCYLLASLAAIARVNPGKIENMISGPNDDGTYNVTLFEETGALWWQKLEPKTYKVSPKFPADKNGAPAYAQPGDKDASSGNVELWVMLIEKAYAMHVGSYEEADGGFGTDAMEALIGKDAEKVDIEGSDDAIATKIDTYLKNGNAVTVASKHFDDVDKKKKSEMKTTKVVGGHDYAVISVDTSAKTINLQNPWGHSDLMALPISDFKRFFNYMNVVHVGKPASK